MLGCSAGGAAHQPLTLGVADLARARTFDESSGWAGSQQPDDEVCSPRLALSTAAPVGGMLHRCLEDRAGVTGACQG